MSNTALQTLSNQGRWNILSEVGSNRGVYPEMQDRIESRQSKKAELEAAAENIRRMRGRDRVTVGQEKNGRYTPESIKEFKERVDYLSRMGKITVAVGGTCHVVGMAALFTLSAGGIGTPIGVAGLLCSILGGVGVGKGLQMISVAGECKKEHQELY
ncbi:MAG: hypothetical protein HYU64_00480 [Armatimonadetes bacterium]|nr:hypothetical protein [Armatimonadota bacterium]